MPVWQQEPFNTASQALEEGSEAHVSVPALSTLFGKGCALAGQINGVTASILVDKGAVIAVRSSACGTMLR